MSEEPILMTKHTNADGVVTLTVASWPRDVVFEDGFLRQADPALLQRDGDMLTIRVSNGQAVYRLDCENYNILDLGWRAHLVSSRFSEPDR